MKKLAILVSSMVLASTSFAFTLKHEQKNNLLNQTKAVRGSIGQNFSGTWGGNCDGENVQLIIKQDSKRVQFEFLDNEGKTDTASFDLNQLVTTSNSSFTRNEAGMKYASIRANSLTLISSEISIYNSSSLESSLSLSIIKEADDSITIQSNDESNACVLKKTN